MAGWFNLLGQIAITAGVGMACTNSIVAMAVMYTSPRLANRCDAVNSRRHKDFFNLRTPRSHGGASLTTIQTLGSFEGLLPNYARCVPLFYVNHNRPPDRTHTFLTQLVLPPRSQEPCPYDANLNLVTSYPWPLPDTSGNAFGPTEVAFDVGECNRVPWSPSQPKVYGVFVGVIFVCALLNTFSINVLNKLVIVSIFIHIAGSLCFIIGHPLIAKTHQNDKTIWGLFVPAKCVP